MVWTASASKQRYFCYLWRQWCRKFVQIVRFLFLLTLILPSLVIVFSPYSFLQFIFSFSTNPTEKALKDAEGREYGPIGKVELLNHQEVSPQPVVAFDWCADKEGLAVLGCLDQSVKVMIFTKLHKI